MVRWRSERSCRSSSCFGEVTLPAPPSPLRCGRARYNISRIMRICGLPSIKYVFPKELRVNMS